MTERWASRSVMISLSSVARHSSLLTLVSHPPTGDSIDSGPLTELPAVDGRGHCQQDNPDLGNFVRRNASLCRLRAEKPGGRVLLHEMRVWDARRLPRLRAPQR